MQPKQLYFEHTDLGRAFQEIREVFEEELPVRSALKSLLELLMLDERGTYLAAGPHQRTPSRQDWANGFYRRDLGTEHGLVRELRVPRTRHGGFQPRVLRRYQRRRAVVDRVLRDLFLAGISTRRVGTCVQALLGEAVSAATVSRVSATLSREAAAFQQRALADCYRYLLLDGVVLKVRGATGRQRRVVLCALGITAEGRRELVAFRVVKVESEAAWTAFLNDLYGRGLAGRPLRLIVTDGCPGLKAALEMVYPFVPQQRCWFHALQNVMTKVRQRDQQACLAGARAIYQASTRRAAVAAFWAWARAWRGAYPQAVEGIEKNLDALLAHFREPPELRRTLRTTNPIERCFREVRRRTRPMGGFNNQDSLERIVYSVVRHLNTQWEKRPLTRTSTHNS
jgi:transposase-like protein